ncbi:ISAs1 family transposase [Spirosoma sp. 209]|uniref:ISAs1 family transposase n=2 Tax=Spirosoma sp. 209 TaxID=1955701 RepID=UPI0011176556|nr:ISAs1 family transposase [Spirosoma sp. 209]
MTTPACPAKATTFFRLLEQTPNLDLRDNRGKRHSVALVLTGLVAALCCGRDGSLSRLHRHMSNQFEYLLEATQLTDQKVISRAQLPVLLAKVNGSCFAKLLFDWFGFCLDEQQKAWFAVDGKELRGSIPTGHTRGEVCVSAVAHQTQQVVGQTYYCGSKESERPTVRQLLDKHSLWTQKISLDALHLTPLTLRSIHAEEGIYVVGLKANQAHLYRQCICRALFSTEYERVDLVQKHHGRTEQRICRCYCLKSLTLAPRWQGTGLATLVCVERHRHQAGIDSEETSYFVSNAQPTSQSEAAELFDAIRQHWCVEVMHHQRDVTLAEDELRSSQAAISRVLSSLRTLVINLLEKLNVKNMVAQFDTFADKFPALIQFFTQQMVL